MIKNRLLYQQDLENVLLSSIEPAQLNGKKIFITGATGMVGICLIDMLMLYSFKQMEPVEIIAMARNEEKLKKCFSSYLHLDNFMYVIGDINFGQLQLPLKPDIIIHAASNSHPVAYTEDPIGTIKTNVFGLDNVLTYAAKEEVERVLFLSSVEVYGENTTGKDYFFEKDFGYIDCNTLRAGYPESKRLGEALCQAYKKKYGLDVVIARLSRLYGPTMQGDDSKVISQFLKKAIAREDIVLKSSGSAKYSYTYVVDAVMALLVILMKGVSGEVYNIADRNSETTILELAKIVAEIAETDIIFEVPTEVEKSGFSNVQKSLMNAEKLEKLGWNALTPLNIGLRKTLDILK